MSSKMVFENTDKEIDLWALLKLLWSKLWIIVVAAVLCAAILFTGAVVFITPQYTANGMMYVNNNSVSVGNSTISFSSSQLSAAKSLLDVYVIILKSRTTLEEVKREADLPYSWKQIRSMVSAGSVNGTEIFSISATCPDPQMAEKIVNTIMDILPIRIAKIVKGSSVEEVDRAVLPDSPSAPSYTRYAMFGLVLGTLLSAAAIVINDLTKTTIRDEEHLKSRYNIPVLALIPDANEINKKGYKYSYQKYGEYRNAAEKGGVSK